MGGYCSREPNNYPQAFTLNQLKDVAVNDTMQSSTGCCPNIEGIQGGSGYDWCVNKRQFTFPNNGEFEFVLGTLCDMCDNIDGGYGCLCPGSIIKGRYPAVARRRYLADSAQCCAKGTATIGTVTCDPKFRGSSKPDCQPIMKQYCDNSSNFFKPECQTWLKNIAPAQKGTADELGNKYCPGSTDPFCACYNITMPPDLKDSAKGIFRCLDASCSGNQQALNTIDCPSAYVDCSINDVNVVLNQSTAQKVTIANNCGVTGPSPSPTPSPSPAPAPSPSPTSGGNNDVVTYALIGVAGLISLILIVLLIIALTKKKPGTAKPIRVMKKV